MGKKIYIAPAIEEMNIETVEIIATSMPIIEEEVDSSTQRGIGRRGVWGDRWE